MEPFQQETKYQKTIHYKRQLVKNDHGYYLNQLKQEIEVNPPPSFGKYIAIEKPMMLNAWTQTSSDDYPKLSSPQNKDDETKLLDKIRQLEGILKVQGDIISTNQLLKNKTPSPRHQNVPNSTTTSPPSPSIKVEGETRYRILAEGNESTGDEQIQIELNEDVSVISSDDSGRLEICTIDENDLKPERPDLEHATVSIGPNDTKILLKEYEQMSWKSCSLATRRLLDLIFDRETLATHSMTGKASPAFKDQNKPVKGRLDPKAIQDIEFMVLSKCKTTSKEIRSAITTKCADENKMLKLKALKKLEKDNSTRSAIKDILKKRFNRVNDNGWMK